MLIGGIFIGCWFISCVMVVAQTLIVYNFLRTTRRISNEQDLERFKSLARFGMYLSLLSLPLMLGIIVTGIILCLEHGCIGLIITLVFNVIMVVLAKAGKHFETKVRTLDTKPDLKADYQQISTFWEKKLFPNF